MDINEFIITKEGKKIVVSIDGEKMNLENVMAIDVHVEYGSIVVNTVKSELFRVGD